MPDIERVAKQDSMSTGAELIAAERQRQITVEGYTPEHDAEHERDGQLAAAAAAYCLPGTSLISYGPEDAGVAPAERGVWHPSWWPWAVRFWKPTPDDRVRELVKAGALIAAEIDRLQASTVRS